MKRTSACLAFAAAVLSALPVAATDGWTTYKNSAFGYGASIPPGFEELGIPFGASGVVFRGEDINLVFLSGPFGDEGLDGEYRRLRDGFIADNGTVAFEVTGAAEASFLGTQPGLRIHTRVRAVCDGMRYLTFILTVDDTNDTAGALAEEIEAGLVQVWCP